MQSYMVETLIFCLDPGCASVFTSATRYCETDRREMGCRRSGRTRGLRPCNWARAESGETLFTRLSGCSRLWRLKLVPIIRVRTGGPFGRGSLVAWNWGFGLGLKGHVPHHTMP